MTAGLGLLNGFPVEPVPDGAVFAPHHLYLGLLAALVVLWTISDNYPHREPTVATVGALAALLGFAATWRYHPKTGALLTLAGVATVVLAPLVRRSYWRDVPRSARVLTVLFGLVALDDAVSHALWPETPLDYLLWDHLMVPVGAWLDAVLV
ncbi:hypothetical protein [Haloarchaeobius sp. HRN-SO-5]|uniref:hypothetical protein n=1 Tax=Haloarchaeobius sp. HRN-SO-5 TaxID=3446118 RepID=UPI003EBBD8DB